MDYDRVGNRYKVFSMDEQTSWNKDEKGCNHCRLVLPLAQFGVKPGGVSGRDGVCRECRKAKAKTDYARRPYVQIILDRARGRAKRAGVPFTLTAEDIQVPAICPVLGIPLERAAGLMTDNSPSLDRHTPSLGYVPGNVSIISQRANRIKSNATVQELERVLSYVRSI